jgi:PleD family two-component response regulator
MRNKKKKLTSLIVEQSGDNRIKSALVDIEGLYQGKKLEFIEEIKIITTQRFSSKGTKLQFDEITVHNKTEEKLSKNCTEKCRLNILIVDNDPVNLLALYGLLLEIGFKSVCCDSGSQAVREFQKKLQ